MHLSLEAPATYIDNASTKKSFLLLHQGTSKRAIQTKSIMLLHFEQADLQSCGSKQPLEPLR
jgi:hypothetical protein